MRLPHPFLSNPGFSFIAASDLWRALEGNCEQEELVIATQLLENGLPPITSRVALSVVLGINSGLVWSFEKKTSKHYREFPIKKGSHIRLIQAPRVALKLVQKWLSIVLASKIKPPPHVYGFVPGRSHIEAALQHVGSEWIFNVDIRNFFQTTPQAMVQKVFADLGYPSNGARLISSLTCLNGYLAQGAPSSPILSNMCFADIDNQLLALAKHHGCRMTRYADDVVFSGFGELPQNLSDEVIAIFNPSPWKLAPEKTKTQVLPHRLKVHGLLVNGQRARLTKGYRNKLRAFAHVISKKADLSDADRVRLKGHLSYMHHVEKLTGASSEQDEPPSTQ